MPNIDPSDRYPARNLPGDAEPWGRRVEDDQITLKEGWRSLRQSFSGLNRSIAAQLSQISDQITGLFAAQSQLETQQGEIAATVDAIPTVVTDHDQITNFGLTGVLPILQFSIPIPENKSTVSISIIGHVEVLDTTSGGLAVATANIEVSGLGLTWSTPLFTASKDAGASAVNNVVVASTGFQDDVEPGSSLLVAMTLGATNTSAFPTTSTNFATLTATAIFTD